MWWRRQRPIVRQQQPQPLPPHSVMATLRNASEPLGMRKRDVFVSSRITVTQTRSFKLFFGPSLGDERSLPDLHNNRLEGQPSGELIGAGGGLGVPGKKGTFPCGVKWELLWKPQS